MPFSFPQAYSAGATINCFIFIANPSKDTLMKRLIFFVLFLGLASYITVQYLKDRRFNPPAAYDYEISDAIDTEFYDSTIIQQYYKLALDAGSYARSLWNNDGIDVRYMDREDFESTQATDYYNTLLQTVIWLEKKLERSKRLRDQGYSTDEIRLMMEYNLSPEDIALSRNQSLVGLKIGDTGADVWELQRLINSKADSIPQDGIFSTITRNRLREFQKNNNLYPSGEVDEKTLKTLLK